MVWRQSDWSWLRNGLPELGLGCCSPDLFGCLDGTNELQRTFARALVSSESLKADRELVELSPSCASPFVVLARCPRTRSSLRGEGESRLLCGPGEPSPDKDGAPESYYGPARWGSLMAGGNSLNTCGRRGSLARAH